jgi:hypothetical protein
MTFFNWFSNIICMWQTQFHYVSTILKKLFIFNMIFIKIYYNMDN